TPSAEIRASRFAQMPPARSAKSARPWESVTLRTEQELFRTYGSSSAAGQSVTLEQLQKSTATTEPAIGLLAKSRTTTWNVKSPAGQTTRQGSSEEFAGEGTLLSALGGDDAATDAQSARASIRSLMGASSW